VVSASEKLAPQVALINGKMTPHIQLRFIFSILWRTNLSSFKNPPAMSNETNLILIESFRQEFIKIKNVADDAIYALRDYPFYHEPFRKDSYHPTGEKPYSIGILMQRTIGNLHSRWTDFLTTDGEKSSRNPDSEFVSKRWSNDELIDKWNEAWMVLFKAIVEELEMKPENFTKTIHIKKHPFTVHEALLRQVSYHMFHCSQIVSLAKAMKRENNYEDMLTIMDKAEEPYVEPPRD
jgi:hypothetical protein